MRLSWDDVAERGADPVTGEFDFEGYRIYRSTDPEFRDPQVITTGTGTGPIGNGRPDRPVRSDRRHERLLRADRGRRGLLPGRRIGITHTWTDTTRDQRPAVLLRGDRLRLRLGHASISTRRRTPSSVSRTPRGGLVLPQNVVQVRPESEGAGLCARRDGRGRAGRRRGSGRGRGRGRQLEPRSRRPLFKITFTAPRPGQHPGHRVRADRQHRRRDSVRERAGISTGEGIGPVGAGLLPVDQHPDSGGDRRDAHRVRPGSADQRRAASGVPDRSLPINLRRPGFPDDITVDLLRQRAWTPPWPSSPLPARPAKFKVMRPRTATATGGWTSGSATCDLRRHA